MDSNNINLIQVLIFVSYIFYFMIAIIKINVESEIKLNFFRAVLFWIYSASTGKNILQRPSGKDYIWTDSMFFGLNYHKYILMSDEFIRSFPILFVLTRNIF